MLILIFWQENKESLWEIIWLSLTLSLALALLSRSLEEYITSFHWGFPCSMLHCCFCLLSEGPLYLFPLSRHWTTQFLFITFQRTAALIRVAVDWSPRCCLIRNELCCSLTHDEFRPLLFITEENQKQKQYFNTSLHWYYLLKECSSEA